eukprot:TRINITY_DN23027_c0_g1_i2.p1 TRINITY_DN23027_c0_g1~~TRINITY_DN23027_c0_g1_i2.p1  ORF type:complete len:551 (+),score=122.80 TRINITY_DN23027_c0_g1_i2:54-1706(+)
MPDGDGAFSGSSYGRSATRPPTTSASSDRPDPPPWLWVTVPGPELSHCAGGYSLLSDVVNGCEVWERCVEPEDGSPADAMWLYSTPNGYWRITDDTADFASGRGYIISGAAHRGTQPHVVRRWATKLGTDVGIAVRQWEGPDVVEEASGPVATDIAPPPSYRVVLERHPAQPLGLGCATAGDGVVVVRGAQHGSAAGRQGLNDLIGWRVSKVCGSRVREPGDVSRAAAGQSRVELLLTRPHADGSANHTDESDDGDSVSGMEFVYVSKQEGEPLGLLIDASGAVAGCTVGSPAARHGGGALAGRHVTGAAGYPVASQSDLDRITAPLGELWLTFLPDDTAPAETPPCPPPTRPVQSVNVTRTGGPLGCRFCLRTMELEEVAPQHSGAAAGLHRFIGWTLAQIGGVDVETPEHFADVWERIPVGGSVEMVFVERRRDPHFPHHHPRGSTPAQFVQRYGAGSSEWDRAGPAQPPRSYWSWLLQRSAARDSASKAVRRGGARAADGTLRRAADPYALGMRAAAGRARDVGSNQAAATMWSATSRPAGLGPLKS